jgi:hypothetical protein
MPTTRAHFRASLASAFFGVLGPFGFASLAEAGPVNPDISVIGDTRATYTEADDDVHLTFDELELAVTGALNPYASGEFYAAIHGTEGIEIEEAKLLLNRYFPAGFGLLAGKYLVDFGQLNQIHSHAYPFVDRPLMHEEFFGDDGVNDIGVRLDWLAPFEGPSVRASAAAVRGDLFLGGHHHEEEGELPPPEEELEEEEPEIGVTGRLEVFAEPSESVSFAIGGSVMHGTWDPHEEAKATWFGPDVKLRFDLGPQSALVVNAEAIFGTLDAAEESPSVDPNGWFASADWRASKRWNFGGFAESTTERLDDDVRTNRYGGFLGMALMEETTLFRIVGRTTDPDEGDSQADVILQAIFALGPHRPHRY